MISGIFTQLYIHPKHQKNRTGSCHSLGLSAVLKGRSLMEEKNFPSLMGRPAPPWSWVLQRNIFCKGPKIIGKNEQKGLLPPRQILGPSCPNWNHPPPLWGECPALRWPTKTHTKLLPLPPPKAQRPGSCNPDRGGAYAPRDLQPHTRGFQYIGCRCWAGGGVLSSQCPCPSQYGFQCPRVGGGG